MDIALLFGIIVLIVALVAFLSARRFGVLALALAAGSVLAGLWADWLNELLKSSQIVVPGLPLGVLAEVILLIAPLAVLLFSGPKYRGRLVLIFSALAIGLLVVAFLIQPLGEFLVLQGDALVFYEWVSGVWQYVVTIGLILGVIDLFLLHTRKPKDGSKH